MAIQPDDGGSQGWIAFLLAVGATAIGWLYKLWFAVRKDVREDQRGNVVNGSYKDVVQVLRDQLREEREMRRAAEEEVEELRNKITELREDGR